MLVTKIKIAIGALLVALIGLGAPLMIDRITATQPPPKPNPRQQPAEAPVEGHAKKAALGAIIAKIRQNEARYDNMEVVVEQASDIGKRKPVEERFETKDNRFSGEFTEFATHAISMRCISQDGMFYFHETDKPVDARGKAFSFNRTRVFDGRTTRVLTQHDLGNKPTSLAQLIAGRSDDEHFVRPHMLLLHFMQFRVPLSTYLSGHKAMMEHPTGNWQSGLTMENSYRGVETFEGLKCHKVWITTCIGNGDQRAEYDRWELWLAEERNYIPVRMRSYTFRWSKDVPISDGVAEDLREIKPGVWFPFSIRVSAYNQYALESLEKREVQWRERYDVQKVSLSPKYERAFFSRLSIPEGTEVEEVKDGKTVRRSRQEKELQKFATGKGSEPAPQEPAWKAEFRKAYGLKDGKLIRRVAPPYPECRAEYFRDQIRELYKRNKTDPSKDEVNRDYSNYFTKFGWKDGWTVPQLTMHTTPVKPNDGVRLVQLIHMTTGFGHTRTEGDAEALARKVTGDFIVRAGADPAKIAAALEKMLRDGGLPVTLRVREFERDVYVLSGKYQAKPLADRNKNQIEVYAFGLTDRTTGGGGSGTLQEMAEHVEAFIDGRVAIGEVTGAPERVEWHFNARSPFTEAERAQDHDAEAVMKNISAQTGLTVNLEKRKIKVLVVKNAE